MYRVKCKKIPFDEDMGLPQKSRMSLKFETLEVILRRNSFDGSTIIIFTRLTDLKVLHTNRIFKGSWGTVSDPKTGKILFKYYVKTIKPMDIWLLDETSEIYEI